MAVIDLSKMTPSVQWPSSPESTGIISPLVSGNYVTPEQAKSMREYADALMKYGQKMPVKSGWQGLAQMSNALMGGLIGNYADKQSRDIVNQGLSTSRPLANTLDSLTGSGDTSTPDTSSASPGPAVASAAPAASGGKDEIDQLKDNISSRLESGGNYSAIGPAVKRADGSVDHAYGKFQVMGSNIPSWTKEVLGRTMTPEEFLKDQNAQEAVTAAKLGQYYQKTGSLQDAASMWFTGRPLAQGANAKDVNGMSGARYAKIATAGITPSDKPADTARVYTADDVAKDNAEGTKNIESGAVAAAVNGGGATPTEAPTTPAYAPDGSAPALSAIQKSAPVAPVPAPVVSGGPNPYQIAALRGQPKPMLNGSSALRMMGDPSVPESMRTMAQTMVTPQTIDGPFGTKYMNTQAGAINGAQPRLVANMGQVQPFKVGKIESNIYSRVNPADNSVSRTVLTPGGSFDLTTGKPVGGSNTNQTSTSNVDNSSGGYAPKSGFGPDFDKLHELSIQSDAMGESAKKDAENASEAAKVSRNTVPAIQNSMNNINQIKGYMDALSKTKDPNTVFGPLEKKSEEIMGILNQVGIGGKSLRDALGNLQGVNKGLNQLISSQAQALEGNNGKALASGIELATQASPNQSLSYQGIVKTMNSLEKIMEYRQNYELAKQDWISEHHNLSGFDKEWTKGVQGGQSSIPTAKPYVLSDTPMEEPRVLPDGSKIIKVPSTIIRKDGKGYTLLHVPKDAE